MKNNNLPKILITGADGFIGQALSLSLAREGFTVRGQIYDSGNRAYKEIAAKADIELIESGDLRAYNQWPRLFTNTDIVVHLAAKVHDMSKDQQQNLAEYRAINVALTEQVAKQAAKAGVKRLVFVSTVKVNGEKTVVGSPFRETDAPNPQDAYAQSKYEAEESLHKINAETGLKTIIVRLPLVYGPGVKANFLRLINLVGKGIPLPLNKVVNKRSLIYLGNLVDALMQCIKNENSSNQTFLVSDDHDISTRDLIVMIAAVFNKKPHLISLPVSILNKFGKLAGKTQEMERLTGSLVVDSAKIKVILGWKPPFSVEAGIRETVDWYKSINKR
jgi:nucleoside-diphosphate-sugar epimerase